RGRCEEEGHADRQHADALTKDQKSHPGRSGRSARWIASRCADLKDPDEEHRDGDAGIDGEPEPGGALRTCDRAREVKFVEMEERGNQGEGVEEPYRRNRDAGGRPSRL